MNIDLSKKLLKSINNDGHPKKLHRYSCSNIYALLQGWEKPETYLEPKTFDFLNAYRMWQGKWKHQQVQSLMPDYIQELKVVKEVGNLTIVGMADLINDEEVIEIKTSEKLHNKAKAWHLHQCKLYCILFDRPVGRIVQPVKSGDSLYLKVIGEVKKDPKWFAREMEKLKVIDDKITEHYAKGINGVSKRTQ